MNKLFLLFALSISLSSTVFSGPRDCKIQQPNPALKACWRCIISEKKGICKYTCTRCKKKDPAVTWNVKDTVKIDIDDKGNMTATVVSDAAEPEETM